MIDDNDVLARLRHLGYEAGARHELRAIVAKDPRAAVAFTERELAAIRAAHEADLAQEHPSRRFRAIGYHRPEDPPIGFFARFHEGRWEPADEPMPITTWAHLAGSEAVVLWDRRESRQDDLTSDRSAAAIAGVILLAAHRTWPDTAWVTYCGQCIECGHQAMHVQALPDWAIAPPTVDCHHCGAARSVLLRRDLPAQMNDGTAQPWVHPPE